MIQVISTKNIETSYLDFALKNRVHIHNVPMTKKKIKTDPQVIQMIQKFEKSLSSDPHPIVFTSSYAVTSFLHLLDQADIDLQSLSLEVFSIAPKTVKTVQSILPDAKVIDIAENASKLAEKIKQYTSHRVSFFCGNRRRDDLIQSLKLSGITVDEFVIYETNLTPVVIERQHDAVIFFSPSAVEGFLKVNAFDPGKHYFAIGRTTAESFTNVTSGEIMTPDTPSTREIVELVCNFYHTSKAT